jgi:hypothetical protein
MAAGADAPQGFNGCPLHCSATLKYPQRFWAAFDAIE